jgi:hypothetical protein
MFVQFLRKLEVLSRERKKLTKVAKTYNCYPNLRRVCLWDAEDWKTASRVEWKPGKIVCGSNWRLGQYFFSLVLHELILLSIRRKSGVLPEKVLRYLH